MASLLTVRCTPSCMRYREKGKLAMSPPSASAVAVTPPRFLRAAFVAPFCAKLLSWPCLLPADVGHGFREGVLLILAEGPGGLEVIVVDKGVHGMMHVSVVRALQVRRTLELERQRLG